jgi:hypothetical protein
MMAFFNTVGVGAGAGVWVLIDFGYIFLLFWFNLDNGRSAYFFLLVVDGVSVVYEKKGIFGLLREDIEILRELF